MNIILIDNNVHHSDIAFRQFMENMTDVFRFGVIELGLLLRCGHSFGRWLEDARSADNRGSHDEESTIRSKVPGFIDVDLPRQVIAIPLCSWFFSEW